MLSQNAAVRTFVRDCSNVITVSRTVSETMTYTGCKATSNLAQTYRCICPDAGLLVICGLCKMP